MYYLFDLSKSDQCENLTCGEIYSCAINRHIENLLCIFQLGFIHAVTVWPINSSTKK